MLQKSKIIVCNPFFWLYHPLSTLTMNMPFYFTISSISQKVESLRTNGFKLLSFMKTNCCTFAN